MITLTSDFGSSEYVGAMRGVIYSLNPGAKLIDITHNIRPFDIRHGAYVIYSTFRYFPVGSVHIIVIDPGVGTKRRSVVLESEGHFFVGPDNGVFSLIQENDIYEINEPKLSYSTFHGRDVFAPIGAEIDKGKNPVNFGRKTTGIKRIMNPEVAVDETIIGEVYCSDSFGNIITSIMEKHTKKYGLKFGDLIKIIIGKITMEMPFSRTYGEVDEHSVLGIINSSGHLEISMNQGMATGVIPVIGGESIEVWKL